MDWLSAWLKYDHISGQLVWKKKPARNIVIGSVAGGANPAGYIRLQVCKQWFLAHRVCWFLHYGYEPSGHIDHIDGNPGNNAIKNLRLVDHQANMRNAKMRTDNTSGLTGVGRESRKGRWISGVSINGKSKRLYTGTDFFEAVCRRKSAEITLGFHKNHGRLA